MTKQMSYEKLRVELRRYKRLHKENEQVIVEMRDERNALRSRHDYMLGQLKDLADGVATKPEWFKEGVTKWDVVLQFKASSALKHVASMRLL